MATVAHRPHSLEEAAAILRELGEAGRPLRVRGGGTKLGWGRPDPGPVAELHTGGLDRVLEHNEGDFTAVLEAGVPLAAAQEQFAARGQMLALDPPSEGATIGGVIATADSGPLRHRYGAPRDLILGITVVLSDGTVARAGGKVIKNVAGYDLGKLFTGSYGTLGLIAAVAVRLHPLSREGESATAVGRTRDPVALARAATRVAALPLEAECLDVRWAEDEGALLARFAGPTAGDRAEMTAGTLRDLGLDADAQGEDGALWAEQRRGQRCPDGVVVKAAGVITDLEAVLSAAWATGGRVVGRAGLGVSFIGFAPEEDVAARVERLRSLLPGLTLSVLEGGAMVSDPWPEPPPGVRAVMGRLKARFDPAGVFRPGVMVSGA